VTNAGGPWGRDVHIGPSYGDRFEVSGSHNIGKIGKVELGRDAADYRLAVEELRSLISELQGAGVVTTAGEIADPRALEDAVAERSAGLHRLQEALASGMSSLIAKTVDTAATPVILFLLDKLLK
jgi:hypothetical protein